MSTLAVAASVTMLEYGLPDLNLENPGIYKVINVGPGAVTWRREYADSRYAHGKTLVSAVMDTLILPFSIRVYGTTMVQLDDRMRDLIRAFEQFDYNLTITIEGVTWTWKCEPADYGAMTGDGAFDPHHFRSLQQAFTFNIPRSPIPVAGSM